jgi:hypothetical protein
MSHLSRTSHITKLKVLSLGKKRHKLISTHTEAFDWRSLRSKHIDNRYHYVRQLLEDNIIEIEHIGSGQEAADMLTKPLKADERAPALITLGIGSANQWTSHACVTCQECSM